MREIRIANAEVCVDLSSCHGDRSSIPASHESSEQRRSSYNPFAAVAPVDRVRRIVRSIPVESLNVLFLALEDRRVTSLVLNIAELLSVALETSINSLCRVARLSSGAHAALKGRFWKNLLCVGRKVRGAIGNIYNRHVDGRELDHRIRRGEGTTGGFV